MKVTKANCGASVPADGGKKKVKMAMGGMVKAESAGMKRGAKPGMAGKPSAKMSAKSSVGKMAKAMKASYKDA